MPDNLTTQDAFAVFDEDAQAAKKERVADIMTEDEYYETREKEMRDHEEKPTFKDRIGAAMGAAFGLTTSVLLFPIMLIFTLGWLVAPVMSWTTNHSFWWAVWSCLIGPIYVIYWMLHHWLQWL